MPVEERKVFELQHPGDLPPELGKLLDMTRKTLRVVRHEDLPEWIGNMESEFNATGLQDVKFLEAKPKSSTLQPLMMDWLWGLGEGIGPIASKHHEMKSQVDKWMEQRERAIKEAQELKIGMNLRHTRCIGRKPLA